MFAKFFMRFVLLDFFRTIAIILILFAHLNFEKFLGLKKFFGIQNFYWVSLGGVAVTMFLILSGIVLELSYGKKKFQYSHFLAKRFLKIYPVYYLSLFVGVLIYLKDNNLQCSVCNISNLLVSITGFYAFIGKWGGPFVATSWFIGLIITMYFLYPFISKKIQNKPHATLIALLLISVLSRILLGRYNILPTRPLDWFPLARIFEFSLGVYLVNIIKKDFWLCMNNFKKIGRIFAFISEISFPLFLIHYPLLFLIKYFSRFTDYYLAIILYLGVSVMISWVILILANKLSFLFSNYEQR
ncbi:MAG: acyltransferase family protein [Patescibacteria group bacterium]